MTRRGSGTVIVLLKKRTIVLICGAIFLAGAVVFGKFNKDDTTMMGYGIQQNNPFNMTEFYFHASSGEVIWKHYLDHSEDVGRGNVG